MLPRPNCLRTQGVRWAGEFGQLWEACGCFWIDIGQHFHVHFAQ